MPGKEDIRTCFVIMPFGVKKDSARGDRVQFDRVWSRIIHPAIDGLNKQGIRIRCDRSDKIQRAGLIHERMIDLIANADVAVVDLTTANPNVYYELGVRHALRDRVTVLLRRAGTRIPFNIAGMTTIEYDLDERSATRAREVIANFVANGLLSGAKDSLVYTVLPRLKASADPKPITENGVEDYPIPRAPGKRIGIVRGNLRHVNLSAALRKQPIDIWVSSENINMEMARPYDPSISGLIRYLGAKKTIPGNVVEDLVANELKTKMGSRQLVNPGEVVSTSAGWLEETHNVKRIFHSASVYGVVGEGYHPIVQVEQCVTNALVRADWEARGMVESKGKGQPSKTVLKSILFPLLATGTAHAEIIQSARGQLQSAINYLRSRADFTYIERVYFLARNEAVLGGLRVALAELGVIKPKPRRKKADGPVKSTIATRAKRKRTTRRARA